MDTPKDMERLPPLPIDDNARARMDSLLDELREMLDDQSLESWREAYYHVHLVMGTLSEYAFGYFRPKKEIK